MAGGLLLATWGGLRSQRFPIPPAPFHGVVINGVILERTRDLFPPGLSPVELVHLTF